MGGAQPCCRGAGTTRPPISPCDVPLERLRVERSSAVVNTFIQMLASLQEFIYFIFFKNI